MNEIVACGFFILHTVKDLLNLSEVTNVTINQMLPFIFPNSWMLYWTHFRDRLSCLCLIKKIK